MRLARPFDETWPYAWRVIGELLATNGQNPAAPPRDVPADALGGFVALNALAERLSGREVETLVDGDDLSALDLALGATWCDGFAALQTLTEIADGDLTRLFVLGVS